MKGNEQKSRQFRRRGEPEPCKDSSWNAMNENYSGKSFPDETPHFLLCYTLCWKLTFKGSSNLRFCESIINWLWTIWSWLRRGKKSHWEFRCPGEESPNLWRFSSVFQYIRFRVGSENLSDLMIIINGNNNYHLLRTSNMPGTEPNTFQALISFVERQSWKRTYISENLTSLFNKIENWGQ